MKSPRTPINKGNYSSMEPPERIARFEALRAAGWEDEYRTYRQEWQDLPTQQYVRDYPLQLDLELSSKCNLSCPMCFTTTDRFKQTVRQQLMEVDLFKRLVDEAAGRVYALRLSLRGEATLHPEFTSCIRYAKEKGIKEVSFLTNLSTMSQEFFGEILAAGADWMTVSIDGLNDTYEKIRKPLRFADTLDKIKMMHHIKQNLSSIRPVIKVQSLWPAIRHNPEEYYDTFAPFVDQVAFNPLIDYLGNDKEVVYMDNFSCPQIYQRLLVGADGTAIMCTNDEFYAHSVGDANQQTIHEIWHGASLNEVRAMHQRPCGFKNMDLCRHCFLPRLTKADETGMVHGREFEILNYVNRSQIVGT